MYLSIPFPGSSPSSETERKLPTSGVLTSPNFPCGYLNDLDLVQRVQVPKGNTIWIRFTDLKIEPRHNVRSPTETVTVTDGDGTRLGYFNGGRRDSFDYEDDDSDEWKNNEIVSNTDTVDVLFHTDSSGYMAGWRLEWGE